MSYSANGTAPAPLPVFASPRLDTPAGGKNGKQGIKVKDRTATTAPAALCADE